MTSLAGTHDQCQLHARGTLQGHGEKVRQVVRVESAGDARDTAQIVLWIRENGTPMTSRLASIPGRRKVEIHTTEGW